TLATAKEAYAQLMRNGPLMASTQPAQPAQPAVEGNAPAPRLLLTGWIVTRSDIRRRRGLRHYLDEAEKAPARLRTVVARLPPSAPLPAATKSAATTRSARPSESTAQASGAGSAAQTTDAAITTPASAPTAPESTGQPGDATSSK